MNSKFQALLAHIEHFQSYPPLQHYEIIRKEEEEWVTIGGEESFLLEGPMQQPDGDHRMVLQSSSAPMDDQQVIPIWFTFQHFWFPYIPNGFHHYLVSSNVPSSWMHLPSLDMTCKMLSTVVLVLRLCSGRLHLLTDCGLISE